MRTTVFRVVAPVAWRPLLLCVPFLLAACQDRPVEPVQPDGIPASLAPLDAQPPEGIAGEALESPPALRVLDRSGTPVPNAEVEFSVVSGGGRLLGDGIARSDAQGVASPGGWVLGVTDERQSVRARAAGSVPALELEATALRPPARVVNSSFLLGEGEYASGEGPPGWTAFLHGAERRFRWELETLVLVGLTSDFGESRLEQCVPLAGPEDLYLHARLQSPHPHPHLSVRLRGEFHPSMESCLADLPGDRLEIPLSADFPLSAGSAVDGAWQLETPVRWAVTRSPEARALRVGLQARDRSLEGGPDTQPRTIRIESFGVEGPRPGTGPAASMEVVAGGGQWARPGSPLARPVGVRVLDAEGLGLPGVPILFLPGSSGSLESLQTVTDDSGIGLAGIWTLGPGAGTHTLTAHVDGADPVAIDAYAVALPAPGTLANGDFGLNAGVFRDGDGPAGWMVEVEDPDGHGVAGALPWAATGSNAFHFPHPTGNFGANRLDQCFPVDPAAGFRPRLRVGSEAPHAAAGLRVNLEFYPDELSCVGDRAGDRVRDPATDAELQVRTDHFPWPASAGPGEWAVVEGGIVAPGGLPPAAAFARISVRVRDRSGGADQPSDPPVLIHLDAVELVPELAAPPGAPTLSHPAGFYPTPLEVTVLPPPGGATVRYTLDGSEPTLESPEWTGPLTLGDRAGDAPVIALIPTHGPGISQVPIWREPIAVPLVHALRVRAFLPGASPGPVVSATYAVTPEGRGRYPLPVLSLLADPDDFFDDDRGIYVPGNSFQPGESRSGNYHGRGRGWERAAHLDFFETDGTTALSHGVGVRIHGGHTRNYPQKSLRLYAREEYGAGRFFHRLFPERPDPAYAVFLLRSSGNDWVSTLFRDALVHTLVGHMAFETQAYRPGVLFLNGEFWGIHNLRERYDASYFERVHGIGEGELDHLELDPVQRRFVAEPGTTEAWDELMALLRSLDPEAPEWMEEIGARVDVESLVDYLAVQLYIANTDWPHNNLEVWRTRAASVPDGASHPADGRFRWVLKDTDYAFGRPIFFDPPADHDHDSLEWILRDHWSTEFYRMMIAHPAFARLLLNRLADLSNATFHPDRVIPVIDEIQARIRPVMVDQLARWRYPAGNWDAEVQRLRWFAEGRAAYVRDLHAVNHFQLEGTARLTVERANGGGRVRVNSLLLDGTTPGIPATGSWTGTYFRGVPVELEAFPAEGFRFDGWDFEGWDDPTGEEREALESGAGGLTLDGDVTLRARFVPEGSSP